MTHYQGQRPPVRRNTRRKKSSFPLPLVSLDGINIALDRYWRKLRSTRIGNFPVWILLVGSIGLLFVMLCGLVTLGMGLVLAGNDILPGVHVAGVDVGGKSTAEAATLIQNSWQQQGILLVDEGRTWTVDPTLMGISLDAQASAEAAHNYGRSDGGLLSGMVAILGSTDIAPVLNIDMNQATTRLQELQAQVEIPAINAGVQLVNGSVQPTPPIEGRVLDINTTLQQLQNNGAELLADGRLELVMMTVAPSVVDSSPMVAQAAQLLSNTLTIRGYDPITNEWLNWTVQPDQWSRWLTATPDSTKPSGLTLTLEDGQLRSFLEGQNTGLQGSNRFLNIGESVTAVQSSVANNNTNPWVQVYHNPTQYTVLPGDTITSIAYDLGVPYPWIQGANPGISSLSIGQSITIPSLDEFVPLDINPNKRIVVSISKQRVTVYESGQVKWDWVASTGINDSPTWPGIYQIRSHDGTAYAGNWNLYMPSFMSVYQPVPGIEFFNGFHGFPSRNGNQILWQNSLGYKVTYGCILLDSTNAELLYDWAEDGVVVEIQQ